MSKIRKFSFQRPSLLLLSKLNVTFPLEAADNEWKDEEIRASKTPATRSTDPEQDLDLDPDAAYAFPQHAHLIDSVVNINITNMILIS